jgi:hypothetical protein
MWKILPSTMGIGSSSATVYKSGLNPMAEDLYKIWLRDVVQRRLTGVELYQSKGPTIVTETSKCLKGLSSEVLVSFLTK